MGAGRVQQVGLIAPSQGAVSTRNGTSRVWASLDGVCVSIIMLFCHKLAQIRLLKSTWVGVISRVNPSCCRGVKEADR